MTISRRNFLRQAGIVAAAMGSIDTVLRSRSSGVGYHRVSNFVHLDTGTCRSWHG